MALMLSILSFFTSRIKKIKEAWFWFDHDTFTEWGEYFELGIPGIAMFGLEWGAYEILSLFAGEIGVLELSTISLLLQFGQLIFCIPLGMQLTATVLVGNAMGGNKPHKAKSYTRIAIIACLIQGIFFWNLQIYVNY